MRSVTEFANFTLNQGLKARADLTAAGKTPEEISAGLGETFKYEGDKLKHFVNSLGVAEQNLDGLKRVRVVALAEGENSPAKAVKIEETTYFPEFHVVARPPQPEGDEKGGKGGRGGRGRGGPRGPGGGRRDGGKPGEKSTDKGERGPKTDKA